MKKEYLQGQIEEITMMDLRRNMGSIMFQLNAGKTFLLSSRNKVIGVLSKVPGIQLSEIILDNGTIKYRL